MSRAALASLIASFLTLSSALQGASHEARINWQSDKPLQDIKPQHDALRFQWQLTHSDGSPIKQAELHIQLQAPRSHPILSTDFPVVENSPLIDAHVMAEDGQFAFSFVPPIRGTYTLKLEVSPLPGDSSFSRTSQEWQPIIEENPTKIRNVSYLLGILILIGGISGYILGRTAAPPKPAGLSAMLLALVISRLCLGSSSAAAHGDEHHSQAQVQALEARTQEDGAQQVAITLLNPKVRVGELAHLNLRLYDASGQNIPARFRLRFTQLEHGIEVFSTEIVAPSGEVNWQGQFYDGSDHRVDVDAIALPATFSATSPLHTELQIAVEAIAPPPKAIIKSFGLLLSVTALAMLGGLLLGLSRRQKEAIWP